MTTRTPWAPGRLWPRLKAQSVYGLETGALQSIKTHAEYVEGGGVRFLVNVLENLSRKDKALKQQGKTTPANPFLPYDPDLYVTDLSASHLCLLNKFNVVDHHFLIVTREFESQENWLTLADFEALVQCLSEVDGLGFFNGGAIAGASQPHKHLQVLPTENGAFALPMDSAIRVAKVGRGVDQGIGYSEALPFRHAIAPIALLTELAKGPEIAAIAQQYFTYYQRLLSAVGITPVKDGYRPPLQQGQSVPLDGARCWQGQQTAAYNLLCTRSWMMVVPRSQEKHAEISVNSLGFAGSLLVRNLAALAQLKTIGPMTLLEAVGCPREDVL
ncbi:MAG: phosphorylase [Cyanobacteria bacterium J06598_3]